MTHDAYAIQCTSTLLYNSQQSIGTQFIVGTPDGQWFPQVVYVKQRQRGTITKATSKQWIRKTPLRTTKQLTGTIGKSEMCIVVNDGKKHKQPG